ncbi:MAG TPA: dienelactone hydrolase family protein [Candidatus Binatia bacterium]|nr:dienelactone hydrolase family protein [Candidatus Binatia bacterium]
MAGTHVTIAAAGSGTFDSYVASPASEKGAGVVIVSTISGVDSDMTYYADALAGEGFVASAPDMFWRDRDPGPLPWTDDGRKRAFARNDRYDLELGMTDLADVIANLKKHPQCNGKVAVMGFCFGGPFALLAAARCSTNAGISFHGSHVENHLDELDRVRCPLSFHYGDRDEVAPMAAIERLREAFGRLADAKLYVYSGAGHGFMTMTRGRAYIESVARPAWTRGLEVLRRLQA